VTVTPTTSVQPPFLRFLTQICDIMISLNKYFILNTCARVRNNSSRVDFLQAEISVVFPKESDDVTGCDDVTFILTPLSVITSLLLMTYEVIMELTLSTYKFVRISIKYEYDVT
jgi:hypothetical protein